MRISITSMIIAFIIIMTFTIIILSQRSTDVEETTLLKKELMDRVINIKTDESQDIKVEKRRDGYSPDDKPFDNRYYAYDEKTKDFRLVCVNPCPVPKEILDQEFAAISYAISTIRGVTQSDIDPSLMPFEVHASEDDRCPIIKVDIPFAKVEAYKTTFTDNNNYHRGLLCFFFDKIKYNRVKFPYSTSIHEVTHLFEENKIPYWETRGGSILWEGLSGIIDAFFLKSSDVDSFCHRQDKWWLTYIIEELLLSDEAHVAGRNLFFNLCREYGFDYDDLPELFDELEKRKITTEEEFIQIINNIVGTDTSDVFREAGVI